MTDYALLLALHDIFHRQQVDRWSCTQHSMSTHKMVVIRLGTHVHMHIDSLVLTLIRKQWCMVMLSSCLA